MNNTNSLVSGDNKGAAAQFMERWAAAAAAGAPAPAELVPGHTAGAANVSAGLVAAFCQANVGDTSPNTQGAFCGDTGERCDAVHSTCGGRVQQCIGRGPAWPNHAESTRIIGQKQADKAQELLLGGGQLPLLPAACTRSRLQRDAAAGAGAAEGSLGRQSARGPHLPAAWRRPHMLRRPGAAPPRCALASSLPRLAPACLCRAGGAGGAH